MPASLVISLLALTALLACRSGDGSPDPEPPPAQDTTEERAAGHPPRHVERKLPNEGDQEKWNAAYDEVVTIYGRSSRQVERLTLEPIVDPKGETVDCYLRSSTERASGRRLFIGGEQLLPNQGEEAAERFFASVGFPRGRKLSRHLLVDILYHLGVLPQGWYAPEDDLADSDALYRRSGVPLPSLTYGVDGGATLTVDHTSGEGDPVRAGDPFEVVGSGGSGVASEGEGDPGPDRQKMIVTFSADGSFTARRLRHIDGNRWRRTGP